MDGGAEGREAQAGSDELTGKESCVVSGRALQAVTRRQGARRFVRCTGPLCSGEHRAAGRVDVGTEEGGEAALHGVGEGVGFLDLLVPVSHRQMPIQSHGPGGRGVRRVQHATRRAGS